MKNKNNSFFFLTLTTGTILFTVSNFSTANEQNLQLKKVNQEECSTQTSDVNPIAVGHNGTMQSTNEQWYKKNKRFLGQDFIGANESTMIFNFYLPIKKYGVYLNESKYGNCYDITNYFNSSYNQYLVFNDSSKYDFIDELEKQKMNIVFNIEYQSKQASKNIEQYESNIYVESPKAYSILEHAQSQNGFAGRIRSGSSASVASFSSNSNQSNDSSFSSSGGNQEFSGDFNSSSDNQPSQSEQKTNLVNSDIQNNFNLAQELANENTQQNQNTQQQNQNFNQNTQSQNIAESPPILSKQDENDQISSVMNNNYNNNVNTNEYLNQLYQESNRERNKLIESMSKN